VLIASAGYTELLQLNLVATGQVSTWPQTQGGVRDVLGVYAGSLRQTGQDSYEVDVHELVAQAGFVVDSERSLDRWIRQTATYVALHNSAVDPLWTTVTGYYSAFFAANALAFACGSGFIRLDTPIGLLPKGSFELKLMASSAAGHVCIQLEKGGGSGSHEASWRRLIELIRIAETTASNDVRATTGFGSLRSLVELPRFLSVFRNDVNYNTARSPYTASMWPSKLREITTVAELEDEVLRSSRNDPQEWRSELIGLGCVSLLLGLYEDFIRRGGKRDPRRVRRQAVAFAAVDQIAWLRP